MIRGLIRPGALATLKRWHEVILAGGLGLIGLWLVGLGGLVLIPLGGAVVAVAAVLALNGWRRLRFAQGQAAPGVVEVDEGQIAYLGPELGGFASLGDLVEIKLLTLRGQRYWRLKQADGQAVLVPVDAQGAEGLFDAFASLPGLAPGVLVAAIAQGAPPEGMSGMRLVWRRTAAAGPARLGE